MRKEREDYRLEVMQKKKKRQFIDDENRRWDMINQFKIRDVTEEYNKDMRKKHLKNVQLYRKCLDEQMVCASL